MTRVDAMAWFGGLVGVVALAAAVFGPQPLHETTPRLERPGPEAPGPEELPRQLSLAAALVPARRRAPRRADCALTRPA